MGQQSSLQVEAGSAEDALLTQVGPGPASSAAGR